MLHYLQQTASWAECLAVHGWPWKQMSIFRTLLRRYLVKHLKPASPGLVLDWGEYEHFQRGVRQFRGYPPAPDFRQLARDILSAPTESLVLRMLALIHRELLIEREVAYCLGLSVGEISRELRNHDADPGLPASATRRS